MNLTQYEVNKLNFAIESARSAFNVLEIFIATVSCPEVILTPEQKLVLAIKKELTPGKAYSLTDCDHALRLIAKAVSEYEKCQATR